MILCLLTLFSCGHNSIKESITFIADEQSTMRQDIPTDSIKGAYLSLDANRYDFGTIRSKETSEIVIEFEVENLGKIPLVIFKADVSCGCMSVDYPKVPVFPNKREKLRVTIDTKGVHVCRLSQSACFSKQEGKIESHH